MRTIYAARHRTYILDTDGTLLAVAAPGPGEPPASMSSFRFGQLYEVNPEVRQLKGPWLGFLLRLARESARQGRALLWPGGTFRVRTCCSIFDEVVRL